MGMNLLPYLTEDEQLLIKRCDELLLRAENGVPAMTHFLSPRERFILEHRFSAAFSADDSDPLCFFFGGFPSAQRTLFCALPAYYRYSLDQDAPPYTVCRDVLAEATVSLRIKTGGYVKLAHRDFLGALIGLGIERSAMGDILLDDEGAIIFVSPTVAGFIKNELVYIGRDKVKACDITLPEDFDRTPDFDTVRGTVASARLDAVLSELTCCSRETAKSVIRRGLVEHNYFTAAEPDAEVSNGDIISSRKEGGCKGGKFIVDSIDERSQKGRIRLVARRFT